MVSGAIALSDLKRNYGMDLLGNLTGGYKQNDATSNAFVHAVNATNEITTITKPKPAGRARLVYDDFASAISSFWSQETGSWSIASNKLQVDSLPPYTPPAIQTAAILAGPAIVDDGTIEAKVTLPSSVGADATVYFSRSGTNSYYGLTLSYDPGNADVELHSIISGGAYAIPAKASHTVGLSDGVEYRVLIRRIQRHVEYEVWDGATRLVSGSYDSTVDFGDGSFGLLTFTAGVLFDDFSFTRLDQLSAPAGRVISGCEIPCCEGCKIGQIYVGVAVEIKRIQALDLASRRRGRRRCIRSVQAVGHRREVDQVRQAVAVEVARNGRVVEGQLNHREIDIQADVIPVETAEQSRAAGAIRKVHAVVAGGVERDGIGQAVLAVQQRHDLDAGACSAGIGEQLERKRREVEDMAIHPLNREAGVGIGLSRRQRGDGLRLDALRPGHAHGPADRLAGAARE